MQTVMKEKLRFVNVFCIITVQCIARVQVNLWYQRELVWEMIPSPCTNGQTFINAG